MTVHSLPFPPPSSDDADTATTSVVRSRRARSPRQRTMIRRPWVSVIEAPDVSPGDPVGLLAGDDRAFGHDRRAA